MAGLGGGFDLFDWITLAATPWAFVAAAALIGCGGLTGSGAVFNRARVEPGESVAVLGVGGIGLNAIQAAVLSGAHPVIAVDTNPDKADVAATFGATDFVNAGEIDANLGIRAIRSTGVDYVFECVGAKTLIEAAVSYLDWGGTPVILGVPPLGQPEHKPPDLKGAGVHLFCREEAG